MEDTLKINEPQSRLKKFLVDIVDIIAFLVFIVGLFLAIKVFVIAPVIVKGHSMLPNYEPGEYIFIDKFYYKLDDGINRGDVAVVMPESSHVSFLKRVVGMPGETITIKSGSVFLCKKENEWLEYHNDDVYEDKTYDKDGKVCKKIKEPYIEGKRVNVKGYDEEIITENKCGISEYKLGKGEYLVFGDDRMYSTDSRCCFVGFCSQDDSRYYIKKEEILGKVRGLKF